MEMEKEKKQERRPHNVLMALVILLLGISIGYAALTTTLVINGESTIKKVVWNIHFSNVKTENGSVSINTQNGEKAAYIPNADETRVEYKIVLPKPGDFYEFTVDVVNDGTLDAKISSNPTLIGTDNYGKYIRYTTVWDDDRTKSPSQGDIINAENSRKVRVKIEYKDDITNEDLPNEDKPIEFTYSMNFVQAK